SCVLLYATRRSSGYRDGTQGNFHAHILAIHNPDSVRSCSAPFCRADRYFLAALSKSRLKMLGNGSLSSIGINDLVSAVLALPQITTPEFVGRLLGGLPIHPCHFEELKSVLLRPHLAITLHADEHVFPSFSFRIIHLTSFPYSFPIPEANNPRASSTDRRNRVYPPNIGVSLRASGHDETTSH